MACLAWLFCVMDNLGYGHFGVWLFGIMAVLGQSWLFWVMTNLGYGHFCAMANLGYGQFGSRIWVKANLQSVLGPGQFGVWPFWVNHG